MQIMYDNFTINAEMDVNTILAVISHIQLACRHPENKGVSNELAREFALKIQETITPIAPELAEVLASGWDEGPEVSEEEAIRIKQMLLQAKATGYIAGQWITSPFFPGVKLVIGFGLNWNPYLKALVVDCTDEEDNTYSCVPIYDPKTGQWASKIPPVLNMFSR